MKEELIRTEQEAIEAIKCNMLREALEIAIKALEEVIE